MKNGLKMDALNNNKKVANSNDLVFIPETNWPILPPNWKLGPVPGVAINSKDQYFIFHRGHDAPPVICFNRKGEVIQSWGEGMFVRPHMIRCDEYDNVWVIDDGAHVIYEYSPEGELLKTIGEKGVPGKDKLHFYRPTDIAFGKNHEYYISDGYGNKRVVRFDKDFNYLGEWGSKGTGEGQFDLPHAVAIDDEGKVYVSDQTNWRIQIFSEDGSYLNSWNNVGKPADIRYASDGFFYLCDGVPNATILKMNKDGKILGKYCSPGVGPGELGRAHGIAITKHGDALIGHMELHLDMTKVETNGRTQLLLRK